MSIIERRRMHQLTQEQRIESYEKGGRETPCLDCGTIDNSNKQHVFVCLRCGRPTCNQCWHARHGWGGVGGCLVHAMTEEGMKEEWERELKKQEEGYYES